MIFSGKLKKEHTYKITLLDSLGETLNRKCKLSCAVDGEKLFLLYNNRSEDFIKDKKLVRILEVLFRSFKQVEEDGQLLLNRKILGNASEEELLEKGQIIADQMELIVLDEKGKKTYKIAEIVEMTKTYMIFQTNLFDLKNVIPQYEEFAKAIWIEPDGLEENVDSIKTLQENLKFREYMKSYSRSSSYCPSNINGTRL